MLAFLGFSIPVPTFLFHHFNVDMLNGLTCAHYKSKPSQRRPCICGLLWGILVSCCCPCLQPYFLSFQFCQPQRWLGNI